MSRGGSLAMWRQFIGDDAIIHGVDLDSACYQLDGASGCVRIGLDDDQFS